METIFYISVAAVLFTYFGYPVLLLLMTERPGTRPQENFFPKISIIIPVYHGEKEIEAKLRNTIDTDYPLDKIEIIVIDDGVEDNTSAIVESFTEHEIKLIRQQPRAGKTAAQKKAVEAASHDIIVFTDLTTRLKRDSLINLLSRMSDMKIGLVSSNDMWMSADGKPLKSGQNYYVRYEMWLRDRESKVNSIVSASGCFYAVRKHFFKPIPDYLIDDIVIPLLVAEKRSRVVHNHEAVSYVPEVVGSQKQFVRRARMTLGGINALFYKKNLLNPFKYGLFSLQLFCHKLLRWLIPFFMIGAFLSNFILTFYSPGWFWLFVLQFIFYGIALLGYLSQEKKNINKLVKIIYFFVSSNMSIVYSWYQFFFVPKQTKWDTSRREQ